HRRGAPANTLLSLRAPADSGGPSRPASPAARVDSAGPLLGERLEPLFEPCDLLAQLLELVAQRGQAPREGVDDLRLLLQRDAYELWSRAGPRAPLLDPPAGGDQDAAVPHASEHGARALPRRSHEDLAGGAEVAASAP